MSLKMMTRVKASTTCQHISGWWTIQYCIFCCIWMFFSAQTGDAIKMNLWNHSRGKIYGQPWSTACEPKTIKRWQLVWRWFLSTEGILKAQVCGFLNKCGVPSEVHELGDSSYFPTRKPGEMLWIRAASGALLSQPRPAVINGSFGWGNSRRVSPHQWAILQIHPNLRICFDLFVLS